MNLEELLLLEFNELNNLLQQMSPKELDALQARVLERMTEVREEITTSLEKLPWRLSW